MSAHPSSAAKPRPQMAASMNVRMPLAMRQELQDRADELGVEVSVVAREAMRFGLPRAHGAIASAIDEADTDRLAGVVRERAAS